MNAVTHGLSSSSANITLDWGKVLMCRDAFVASAKIADNSPDLDSAEELAFLAAEQQAVVDRVREARRHIWAAAQHCDELNERGGLQAFKASLYPPEEREWVRDVSKLLKQLRPHLFQEPCETVDEERAVIADVASKELKKLTRFERRAARLRDKYLKALQGLGDQHISVKSQNEPNS